MCVSILEKEESIRLVWIRLDGLRRGVYLGMNIYQTISLYMAKISEREMRRRRYRVSSNEENDNVMAYGRRPMKEGRGVVIAPTAGGADVLPVPLLKSSYISLDLWAYIAFFYPPATAHIWRCRRAVTS